MNKLLLFSLLFISIYAQKKNNWGVLVAGSNGYWNYRHQADVFHAYQILKKNGIAEDHIIVFAYDDIAQDRQNPFRGKIFNRPDGEDVYEGVKIDYKKGDVTPKNFMSVLTGDEEAMKGIGSGKVLKSDSNSNIFMFFSDHGSPGMIAFPRGDLYADNLKDTFITMYEKKMFNKLIFYLEACYSGSMFNKIDKQLEEYGIYGISAANPHESSWGCYCGREAKVGGVNIGSCLGDLFSVSWMEHSDIVDLLTTTVGVQVDEVTKRTAKSEVCQYGDKSPRESMLIEFQGEKEQLVKKMKFLEYVKEYNNNSHEVIKSTEIYINYLKNKALTTNDKNDILAYKEELRLIARSKRIFQLFRKKFNISEEITDKDVEFNCYRSLIHQYKKSCGFNIDRDNQYLSAFYNYCAGKNASYLATQAIEEICYDF